MHLLATNLPGGTRAVLRSDAAQTRRLLKAASKNDRFAWRTHDEYQLQGKVTISCETIRRFSVGSRHPLSLHTSLIMCDNDGLLVPRPTHTHTHTPGPSPEEQALAWTLIIESGHIPLRTRLGTCKHELRGPLRRRHLEWVQKIIFQDLHSVWASLQANTG